MSLHLLVPEIVDGNTIGMVNTSDYSVDLDEESEVDAPGVFEMLNRIANRPLLYDSKHPKHKDRGLVKIKWEEVASDLKVGGALKSADWCKKKWRKQKDYYNRKKREAIKKSGSGGGHKMSWQFYSAVHAIMKKCDNENEATISNLDEDDGATAVESIGVEQRTNATDTSAVGSNPDPNQSTPSPETSTNTTGPTSAGGGSKRKKRSTDSDGDTERILQFLKDSGKEEDEAFHFSMVVAERLRKMSPRTNRKAQMKIQQILYEVEFPSEDNPESGE